MYAHTCKYAAMLTFRPNSTKCTFAIQWQRRRFVACAYVRRSLIVVRPKNEHRFSWRNVYDLPHKGPFLSHSVCRGCHCGSHAPAQWHCRMERQQSQFPKNIIESLRHPLAVFRERTFAAYMYRKLCITSNNNADCVCGRKRYSHCFVQTSG